jgi:hypothetical protein
MIKTQVPAQTDQPRAFEIEHLKRADSSIHRD